jgi:hypothetical protein
MSAAAPVFVGLESRIWGKEDESMKEMKRSVNPYGRLYLFFWRNGRIYLPLVAWAVVVAGLTRSS